jgi:tetratricopeptide (TPR) repeat protein
MKIIRDKRIISIFPLLLLLFVPILSAQTQTNNTIDSLLTTSLNISEKLFYEGKFEEAKKYLRISFFEDFEAFTLTHKVKLLSQLSKIRLYENKLYRKQKKQQEVLNELLEIHPAASKLKDKAVLAGYLDTLGSACLETGNRDIAGQHYDKAFKLYAALKDTYNMADTGSRIIMVRHLRLRAKKDHAAVVKLIPEYENEIEFARKVNNKFALSFNTRHLGNIYLQQLKDYGRALKFLGRSLALRKEINFKPYIPPSYSSMGDIFKQTGETAKAIEMYSRSIEAAEEVHFIRYMFYPRLMLGDIYKGMNNLEKAKAYYKQALKIASANHDVNGIEEALTKYETLFIKR